MTFINLTPHAITLVDGTVVPTSGTVARCAMVRKSIGVAGNMPLFLTAFGDVQDLPPSVEGCFYIVSALVRTASPNRFDLASPADLVRDDKGNIIGCKSFDVN
jgi:hypothetical protein